MTETDVTADTPEDSTGEIGTGPGAAGIDLALFDPSADINTHAAPDTVDFTL